MQESSPSQASSPENAGLRRRARAHLKAVVDAVLSTGELDDPRWNELAVVFSVSGGGRNFGNSGYAYGENGEWWAVSFPVLAVKRPIVDLLTDLRDPLPEGLTRVLLQYSRTTNRARLIPEFDHPERWSITPQTARSMMEELRPVFGVTHLQ